MNENEVIEYIRKFFIYDNGAFIRNDRKNSNGSLDKDGYLIIKIKGKQYKAHRLVYAYFNGEFPKGEIDHINRCRTDNRIENLRVCSRQENVDNTRKVKNKDTEFIGVYLDKATKGLKKRYAFKFKGNTYRFYSAQEAFDYKEKLKDEINNECI